MSKKLFDNGETYVSEHDGELWFCGILATRRDLDGLRAWFQAERDRELGRWNDPVNSDYLVYRTEDADEAVAGRCVRVVSETTGVMHMIWEANVRKRIDPTLPDRVALRYFDAHPQAWFSAKPGEAWAITVGGTEMAALVARKAHEDPIVFKTGFFEYDLTSPSITAGRRVWAPGDGDDDDGE